MIGERVIGISRGQPRSEQTRCNQPTPHAPALSPRTDPHATPSLFALISVGCTDRELSYVDTVP